MGSSSHLETEPGQLFVTTLGQFSLVREGQVLEASVWVREKARILFQYLITNRKQFIPRDRITFDLWPDLDPEKASRDFKVALSAANAAIRGADEPDRDEEFILRQGLSYRLNEAAPIAIDAELFERYLEKARKMETTDVKESIRLYRSGLEMYGGEYLPERLYDDWTSSERERLTTLFLLGSTSMAMLLLGTGEADEAIIWSERVTAVDPLWEEAYRIQMLAYNLKGNRPKAVQVYSRCRRILGDELGIEPMAGTTAVYNQIMS